MINILRKHQQFLMICITIMVIIAFVWLYNGTQFDKMVRDEVAKIYGKPVSQMEVDRQARRFQLSIDLGLFDMIQDLAGMGGFDRAQMFESFIWNTIILRHEAERLQIQPGDELVTAEIQKLAPFQTNGGFDPNKYGLFLQDKLSPRGFTTSDLEELIRDRLRLREIKALLASSVTLAPEELRAAYQQSHQKSELSLVRFSLDDFAKAVNPSEEDLKKAYEQRKETLKSEQQRKIKIVKLELTPEELKLTGKPRIDLLQKLANRANEITQAMLNRDARFDEVAAKAGVPVTETALFSQTGTDPALPAQANVKTAAFKLTKADPNSDVLQTETGFYVIHLEEIVEPKQLTFEEAKPQLLARLKEERAREAMKLKAADFRKKVEAEMKSGKTFADAAKVAGEKVEKIADFSPLESAKTDAVPDFETLQANVPQLAEGQLSQALSNEGDERALIVYVDKRLPIDEAEFTKEKERLTEAYLHAKREMAFREWLRVCKDAAKVEAIRS